MQSSDINTEHMVLPASSVPEQPSDKNNWIHVPPAASLPVQPSDIIEHTVQPNASVPVQQSDITEHRLPMMETTQYPNSLNNFSKSGHERLIEPEQRLTSTVDTISLAEYRMSEKEDAPSQVEDNNFQQLLTTVSDVVVMVKNYCKEKNIVDPIDILI